MSKHTIDVIIPTYNGLPWLKATIESVLTQTHKDLLLYIMDDGSTDATKKYVKSLKDKRVHYIYKENGGQSSARNLGFRSSASPFVAFLDADDIWYPTKLEKQLLIMNNNPAVGLVYGHHYLIDEEDVIQGNLRIWKRGNLVDDLTSGNCIAGSASMVLIRREVMAEAGPFKEDFVNGEDWELWLRIAMRCEIDFVPEIIAAIRQHGNNWQSAGRKMADGLVYAFSVMKDELPLNRDQRIRVAGYCLFNAAATYQSLGLRGDARRTLYALFKENPRAFFEWQNWKLHIGYGLFARVVLGNPVFDFILRCYRYGIRLLTKGGRFVLRYPYRVVRRVYRYVKYGK